MSGDELTLWRKLAEQATPGPWRVEEDYYDGPCYVVQTSDPDMGYGVSHKDRIDREQADAAFIAHSSPDRILALIDEVLEMRQRDKVISRQLEQRAGGRDAFTQALLAELDAEKDKAEGLASAYEAERARGERLEEALTAAREHIWIDDAEHDDCEIDPESCWACRRAERLVEIDAALAREGAAK